jgi:predicted molibdopterin-dependent oxidoreductase YjgC
MVSTFEDKPIAESRCVQCGECVKVCSVGALVFKEAKHNTAQVKNFKPPAEVLLELSGSWEDERDSETIIAKIKKARKNSKGPQKGF